MKQDGSGRVKLAMKNKKPFDGFLIVAFTRSNPSCFILQILLNPV